MKVIRALVVDDEPLARARIVKLLEQAEGVICIGECKNGREALRRIRDYQPDLVFLDIEMPDLNGFDVLKQEELKPLPFIIFVTAYDQYALKAFDVHAVDYLLKPYDDDRFGQALDHAREQIQTRENAELHQKMVHMLKQHEAQSAPGLQFLEVKDKGRTLEINVLDVQHFEADGNYLIAHTGSRRHLIRQTLQSVADALPAGQFLRIHRSLLVNTHAIERVQYDGNNQYTLHLRNGEALASSRGYKTEIHQYLEARGEDA
jgi:two-component system LytT family response regulator